jgi:competence protein ComEC
VIAALVVGDQRAISTEEWSIFQRTGVSHLMRIRCKYNLLYS